MADQILILSSERDGNDGLIVTFSDGTIGAYVVEELLRLRPHRERVKPKTHSPLEKRLTVNLGTKGKRRQS